MPRSNEQMVREAVGDYTTLTGRESPLQYISRPGGGEAARYVFQEKTCLGAAEALAYVNSLIVKHSRET